MNFFKLLGNLGNLSKIQEEVQLATAELGNLQFQGEAGGGMVTVQVSGTQQVLNCSIDPKLIEDNDRELIEGLVVAAVNEALTKSKREAGSLVQKKIAEKLNMPELSDMISNFLPKS